MGDYTPEELRIALDWYEAIVRSDNAKSKQGVAMRNEESCAVSYCDACGSRGAGGWHCHYYWTDKRGWSDAGCTFAQDPNEAIVMAYRDCKEALEHDCHYCHDSRTMGDGYVGETACSLCPADVRSPRGDK